MDIIYHASQKQKKTSIVFFYNIKKNFSFIYKAINVSKTMKILLICVVLAHIFQSEAYTKKNNGPQNIAQKSTNIKSAQDWHEYIQTIPLAKKLHSLDRYVFDTNVGSFEIQIFPHIAPQTCQFFHRFAVSGFYNNTQIHRVVKQYLIQGGDILTKDLDPSNDGLGGLEYSIPAEWNYLRHTSGIVSLARAKGSHQGSSQFFIILNDAPELDGQYTVFGRVSKGMDVLQKIGDVPVTYSSNQEKSRPINPIVITRIRYIPYQNKAR